MMYWLKKKTRGPIGSLIGLTFQRFIALAAVISFGISVIYPRGLTAEESNIEDEEDDGDDDADEEDENLMAEEYMLPYRSDKNGSQEQAALRDEKTGRFAVKQALDMSDRKELLMEHNLRRRNLTPTAANMVYLVWSLELEKAARMISRGCREVKSIPHARKKFLYRFFSFTGVNVYQRKSGTMPVTAAKRAVRRWGSESKHYNFDWNSCKLGKTCESFLKVIWGEASHVGCALTVCAELTRLRSDQIARDREFVVCVYGGGNEMVMRKNQPYLIGESCSSCPNGFSNCVDGLCQTDPVCQTVVDCSDVKDTDVCLCDEDVYKSGQQRIVGRLTPLHLKSMTETAALLLLSNYLLTS